MSAHPVDRLGEIRAEIRALRKEAKTIVAKVDSGAITDTGQRYRASMHMHCKVHPIPQPPLPDQFNYQSPLQNYQHQAAQGLGGVGNLGMGQSNAAFGTGSAGGFGDAKFGTGRFGGNGPVGPRGEGDD